MRNSRLESKLRSSAIALIVNAVVFGFSIACGPTQALRKKPNGICLHRQHFTRLAFEADEASHESPPCWRRWD